VYFETFFLIHFGLGITGIENHVIRKQMQPRFQMKKKCLVTN